MSFVFSFDSFRNINEAKICIESFIFHVIYNPFNSVLGDGVIDEDEYVGFMKSFAYTDDDPANNFTNICQVR